MRLVLTALTFFLALGAASAEAKDDPAPSNPVLVSWEQGRPSAAKESRSGALISWEPGRGPGAASVAAPQIPPGPLPVGSFGARQFDIEEIPVLPSRGAVPPVKIVPVTSVFSPPAADEAEDAAATPSV